MPEVHHVALDVELSEDERRAINGFGLPPDQALAALGKAALEEWLAWLIANDRPASLTEISKRRIKALVNGRLLPSVPTAAVLAQRLRLTLGQARYVITALSLENPAATEAARIGLIRSLTAALADAGIADPIDLGEAAIARLRADNPVAIDAPRALGELAAATHEEILNEEFGRVARFDIEDFRPPKITRQTDAYVRISVRPHVAIRIIQRLSRGGG